MKKKSILMVACLLVVSLAFAGCGFQKLSKMPSLEAEVLGNGGLSVTKGEYVYYVDSFVESSSIAKDGNTYNKIKNASIYRAKMVDNKLVYNEDGVLQNVELVVPKIVGFENTNLFIFDDYIYYGTPNTQYDKSGTLRNDLIDFCRAKLDGSNVQIIYTTDEYSDNATHSFYKVNDKVYLVVFEGSDLVKVEIGTHIKKAVVLAEDLSSVMLPSVNNYTYAQSVTASGTLGYAYYTRDLTEDDGFLSTSSKGNVLGRVDIVTDEKTEIKDGETTHELSSVQSNYVYDYKTKNGNKCLYATSDMKSFIQVTTTDAYSDVVVLTNVNGENRGIIATFDDKTVWIKDGTNVKESSELVLDSSITVKYVDNDYIYYLDGTKIYRVSLADFTKELVVSDSTMNTSYFDFTESGYVYYFATYTGDKDESGVYLNRVNLSQKVEPEEGEEETDLGYEIELVGVLAENHTTTEDEE